MFSTLEGATFQAISLELEHGDVWELGRGNLEEFCNVWQYDFSIRKFGFPNQEIPSGNTGGGSKNLTGSFSCHRADIFLFILRIVGELHRQGEFPTDVVQ